MSNIKIVIADRGWVFIGRVSLSKSNSEEYISGKVFELKSEEYILLKDAYVIRRWGTSEGLGELCIKGKLEDTILDKCKDVEISQRSIIALLECDDSKWDHIL